MIINNLSITNFRNYSSLDVQFDERINVLIGDNGQGKTNILEAIYLLSTFKSFRSNYLSELIKHKEPFFNANGSFNTLGYNKTLDITVKRDKSKNIRYNGEIVSKISDVYGEVACVAFCPDDLTIIKGEPSVRRRFFDMAIGQISRLYIKDLQDYNKILRQKNASLKNGLHEVINIWNSQLCITGEKVVEKRGEYISLLEKRAKLIHAEIAPNEDLCIKYFPNIQPGSYQQELQNKIDKEILLGTCICGAQRDDVEFYINGKKAKVYGSQGQQKTASLSTKIAQVELLFEHFGEYPVLLLDDVMSELDTGRREYLSSVLKKTQTFITCTEIGLLPVSPDVEFNVKNGGISLCRYA